MGERHYSSVGKEASLAGLVTSVQPPEPKGRGEGTTPGSCPLTHTRFMVEGGGWAVKMTLLVLTLEAPEELGSQHPCPAPLKPPLPSALRASKSCSVVHSPIGHEHTHARTRALILKTWVKGMVPRLRVCVCKNEDLGLNPWTPHKRQGMVTLLNMQSQEESHSCVQRQCCVEQSRTAMSSWLHTSLVSMCTQMHTYHIHK